MTKLLDFAPTKLGRITGIFIVIGVHVLDAASKVVRVVKFCIQKILQFLTGGAG